MAVVLATVMAITPLLPLKERAVQEWSTEVAETGGLTRELVTEYHRIQSWFEPEAPVYIAPQPRITQHRTHPAGVEQWRNLIATYFDPVNVPWAMRVMACESGGDPAAQNPRSSAGGLFQFVDRTWAETPYGHLSKYDPEANIAAAAWLLEDAPWGGPGHWVCR